VPVGVGNTNGDVGDLPEGVEEDVDDDVNERFELTVVVLVIDVAFRATSSAGGTALGAMSDGTGSEKEPVIEIRRNAGENP